MQSSQSLNLVHSLSRETCASLNNHKQTELRKRICESHLDPPPTTRLKKETKHTEHLTQLDERTAVDQLNHRARHGSASLVVPDHPAPKQNIHLQQRQRHFDHIVRRERGCEVKLLGSRQLFPFVATGQFCPVKTSVGRNPAPS